MDLIDVIQQIVQNTMGSSALTDLVLGTVTSVSPLQIMEQNVRDPIPEAALLLTEAVIEKKIPVMTHNHAIRDTYTGGGTSDNALSTVACYENGRALPVSGGFIILNRALAVGDKVVMLRVQGGQKYIVLSRVF